MNIILESINYPFSQTNVTRMIEVINVPVYCFMVHATSSVLFLIFILWICNTRTEPYITIQEYILWTFVLGRVLVETQQIQRTRMTEYLSSMWNIVDIISLILFVAIIVMRITFYFAFHHLWGSLILPEPTPNITVYNYYDRIADIENLDQIKDDILKNIIIPKIGAYSENDLLAVINIIYSINSIIACTRLLPLFEASYSLGPLQLTMGGMLADLSKIMCLLLTVILAFSLGIAKLYNSRFFYLFVDGTVGPGTSFENPVSADQQKIFHTERSIQCLYNPYKDREKCGFTSGFIEPVLFKR